MYAYNLKYPASFTLQSAVADGGTVTLGYSLVDSGYRVISVTGEGSFSGLKPLTELTFLVPEDTDPGAYTISIEKDTSVGKYIQFVGSDDQISAVTAATVQVVEGSAQPPASAGSYTACIKAPDRAVAGDETVEFTVEIDGDGFSAVQMTVTYDHQLLLLKKVTPGSWNEASNGTVTVVDFGNEKGTPASYTLTFAALADGEAAVTLESVLLGDADSAASENAVAARITTATASVHIAKRTYSVVLPDMFVGADAVTEGEDYTFQPADRENYIYSNVQVTMGGQVQTLTPDEQGKYTVVNVTGDLQITGERTARSYTITFRSDSGADLPNDATVTYGVDYSFTIPTEANYDVTLTSIKTGERDVPFTISDGVVTIAGSHISGDITVTLDRERNNATVVIPASLSGLLSGGKNALPGEDYTVTLTPDDRYVYTVTATVNGHAVELTQSGNRYTISGEDIEAGDEIVFDVKQTLRTDKLTVKHYLQLDGASFYLVQNKVSRETEYVYTYNGTEMLWSAEYNAYCCLVLATDLESAGAGTLGLKAGRDRALVYGTDANLSGTTDINDAQFVYNLYNAKYDSFTGTVTMEKVLCADTNGDGTVNVSDAQMIVDAILGVH